MATTSPLRGVNTVSFFAADHVAAARWYTEFLGVEPYFERPGYVAFREPRAAMAGPGSLSIGTSMTSTPCSKGPSPWAQRS